MCACVAHCKKIAIGYFFETLCQGANGSGAIESFVIDKIFLRVPNYNNDDYDYDDDDDDCEEKRRKKETVMWLTCRCTNKAQFMTPCVM